MCVFTIKNEWGRGGLKWWPPSQCRPIPEMEGPWCQMWTSNQIIFKQWFVQVEPLS